MQPNPLVNEVHALRKFFHTSVSIFTEADSTFAPKPDMFTVAQQVAHTAQTIDWFMDAAFDTDGKGFDMDFEKMTAETLRCTSLAAALALLDKACDRAVNLIGPASMEFFQQPIPGDQICPGVPRIWIIGGMTDHTAHHRGALTVYARLLGKVAPMPYA